MHMPPPSKKSAAKSAPSADPFDGLASVLRQLFAGSAAKGDAALPLPEPEDEEDEEDEEDLFPMGPMRPMGGKKMRRISISILMPMGKSASATKAPPKSKA